LRWMMLLNWQNRLKFNQIKPGDAVSGVFRFSKADTYELFIRGNYRHIAVKESAYNGVRKLAGLDIDGGFLTH
jgi:hypothetical protein